MNTDDIKQRYALDDPDDWSAVIYQPTVAARPTESLTDPPVPDFAQMEYRRAIINAFADGPEQPLSSVWVSIYLPAMPEAWCAHATKNVQDALVDGGIIRGDRASVQVLRSIKGASPYEGASFIEVSDLDGGRCFTSMPIAYPSATRTITAAYSQSSQSIELTGMDDDYVSTLREEFRVMSAAGNVLSRVDLTADSSYAGKTVRVLVGENSDTRSRRFDPDNVALRMIDMLETARSAQLLLNRIPPPLTLTQSEQSTPIDQLIGGFDCCYTPDLEGVVLALSTQPVVDEAYVYFSRYMPPELRLR